MYGKCVARLTAGAVLALAGSCLSAAAATLTIACGSGGTELEMCKRHADEWARRTGNTVKTFTQPGSATEALALYRQLFAGHSTAIDVVRIDTVWPGVLKDHLIDLRPYAKAAVSEFFPAIVANDTVDGKLVAMPWYIDAGLLYYRKDLLAKYHRKVPETWREFAATARIVQDGERAEGAKDFYGYVFQGKAYEGLTCNALEWIASFGGGAVVDEAGRITVDNPRAIEALDAAASWVKSFSPRGVLNYDEEDSRGVFESGSALFMRSWPYVWKLAQTGDSPVKGRVGVALLPRGDVGGRHVATLGGWQLAVSKYSLHVDLAADLVMYMTSAEVQKQRAIEGGFNPSRPALYRDPEVVRANGFMARLVDVFDEAVLRPSSQTRMKYPAVSKAIWDHAHDVLSGRTSAMVAAHHLDAKLHQIRRARW